MAEFYRWTRRRVAVLGGAAPHLAVLPQPADLNGDGAWDALDVSTQTVWYGNPQQPGTYASSASFAGAASGLQLVDGTAVDMNGDGYDDAVISVKGGGLLFLAGSADALSTLPVILPPSSQRGSGLDARRAGHQYLCPGRPDIGGDQRVGRGRADLHIGAPDCNRSGRAPPAVLDGAIRVRGGRSSWGGQLRRTR